jgi:hypothetical protein
VPREKTTRSNAFQHIELTFQNKSIKRSQDMPVGHRAKKKQKVPPFQPKGHAKKPNRSLGASVPQWYHPAVSLIQSNNADGWTACRFASAKIDP